MNVWFFSFNSVRSLVLKRQREAEQKELCFLAPPLNMCRRTWLMSSQLRSFANHQSAKAVQPFLSASDPPLYSFPGVSGQTKERSGAVRAGSGRPSGTDWIILTIRERSHVIKVMRRRLSEVTAASACREHNAAFVWS